MLSAKRTLLSSARHSCQQKSVFSRQLQTSVPKEPKQPTGRDGKPFSFLRKIWERYTAALMARPLTVKASTASLIFFVSDSMTQYVMDSTAEYDIARAGSGAAFGVVATGWLHYWWNFLESFVGKRLPLATHRLSNTIVKVFLDQAIGAPIYIYTYYVITNFIQELNLRSAESEKKFTSVLEETCGRATEMLPPTMMRHWTVWPAVHTLNFYFSPLHHRVLVQNLVLVGWSGYLSHLNNGGLVTPKEEVEEMIKRRETQKIGVITKGHATTQIKIKGLPPNEKL